MMTFRDAWSFIWDVVFFIPHVIRSLFVPPVSDDIQSMEDLIYEFGQAFMHIPSLLRRLAFKTRTLEEELHEAMIRGNLRRSFTQINLLCIGIGIVVGSGIFSLTAEAAALSAVVISYAIMGFACACAAACYAELCVEMPIAGSAFIYVMVTFGELPAYLTMGMLLEQYVLAMAAVARGFSQFLSLLCDLPSSAFVINYVDSWDVDFMAFGIVLLISLFLCFLTPESIKFINFATGLKIVLILFISIMGYAKARGGAFVENFTLPSKGADGVFQGAAIILFAYVAFDAVCNAVEETQRIEYIPPAIIGTVGISALLYCMLAVCLCLMVSPNELLMCTNDRGDIMPVDPSVATENCGGLVFYDCSSNPDAPLEAWQLGYVYAFNLVGTPWMQFVVALAALFGIVTALIVGLYSVSRLVMVAAREWLLPPILAHISPRTQTPALAQIVIGIFISVIALFVEYTWLAEMANFGALFAMYMVVNSLLYRRYYPKQRLRFTQFGAVEATSPVLGKPRWNVPGSKLPLKGRKIAAGTHIFLINAICIALGVYYRLSAVSPPECTDGNSAAVPEGDLTTASHDNPTSFWFVVAWAVTTLSMLLWCPIDYEPTTSWAINRYLLPWLPSVAILLISFSAANLDTAILKGMAWYVVILLLLYVFVSMPLSYIKHFKLDAVTEDDLEIEEIAFHGGKWQPVDLVSTMESKTQHSTVEMASLSFMRPRSAWTSGPISGPVGRIDSRSTHANSGSARPPQRGVTFKTQQRHSSEVILENSEEVTETLSQRETPPPLESLPEETS